MTVSWIENPLIQEIGWTLVQFLWQGTLLSIAYAVVRAWWGRSAGPVVRYRLACVTLLIMTAAPVATFVMRPRYAEAPLTAWPLASEGDWERVMPWVVGAWVAGVLLFSVRLIGGWTATFRLRRTGVREAPAEWQERLADLMQRMRLSRPVRLLISPLVDAPGVVGWYRPVILIPVGALTGLAAEYLEALLVHELAHVRRLDFLTNMLQGVAEAVLFYHPAVWWVSDHIRVERESICDDIAVAACGDVLTYARALSELESCRGGQAQLALAANDGPLLARIRRLVGRTSLTSPLLPSAGTIAAIVVLWFAGVGSVVAQDPWVYKPPAPEPPATVALNRSAAISTFLFSPQGPSPRTKQTPKEAEPASASPKPMRVAGRITDDAGQPVAKATVTLVKIGADAGTGAGARPAFYSTPAADYTVKTDDDGTFAIGDVEASAYRVHVERQGYLGQTYGAAEPGDQPGRPITVRDAESAGALAIVMQRQGVIAGRVLDGENGLLGWEVRAMQYGYVRGNRQLRAVATAMTDDHGAFRVANLVAGSYYLVAELPQTRGLLDVAQGNRNGALVLPTRDGAVLMPTYAPDSANIAGAAVIKVEPGVLASASIRVQLDRKATVRGVLAGLTGGGARGNVLVNSDQPQDGASAGAPSVRTDINGGFELHLSPGDYTLWGFGPCHAAGRFNTADPANEGGYGSIQIHVRGTDIEDLRLPLKASGRVHGTLKLEGGTFADFPRSEAGGIVFLGAMPRLVAPVQNPEGAPEMGEWDEEGNFTIPNVMPGRYLIRWPAGFYVKSLKIDGVDMNGKEWNFDGSDARLDILYARDFGSISGTAVTEGEQPAGGSIAVLWPKIVDPLSDGGGVRTVTANNSGAFAFANVAPGEYYVAAFAPLRDAGLLQLRPFLERMEDQTVLVKVGPLGKMPAQVTQISAQRAAVEAAQLK